MGNPPLYFYTLQNQVIHQILIYLPSTFYFFLVWTGNNYFSFIF